MDIGGQSGYITLGDIIQNYRLLLPIAGPIAYNFIVSFMIVELLLSDVSAIAMDLI